MTRFGPTTTMNIKFGNRKTGSSGGSEKPSNVAWGRESGLDVATAIPTANIRILNMSLLAKLVNFILHNGNASDVLIGRFDDNDQWPREDEMDLMPASVDRGLTGEEAYQRRLAMSAGLKPRETSPRPTVVDRALTGDEAYQRRLALSAGLKSHEPTPPLNVSDIGDAESSTPGLTITDEPSVYQSTTGEEAYLRRIAMSTIDNKLSPAVPASPPPLAYNPFAPPPVPSPPPAAPATSSLEEKVKAAAAIAAKLSALGKSDATLSSASPTPPPAPSEDKR
jgi:splicing factor 45